MFWNKWFKKKIIQPTTLIGGIISSLEDLDIYKFKDVYSSDYSNILLLSVEKNILTYTELLKNLNNQLAEEKFISYLSLPTTISEMYLSDFFTVDGFYIDTITHAERFRDEAIILLTNYENIEKKLEKSAVDNRNLMTISQVMNNIIQIAKVLNYGKS